MPIDAHGLCDWARQIASPNCDTRPAGASISLVVIHNISLPPGEFAGNAVEHLFTNTLNWEAHPYYQGIRGLKVSAHFFIRRDGQLIQFVPCHLRAWHAGVSSWKGREKCNDFSIGIELEGSDEVAFTEAQYTSLNTLLAELADAYQIDGIVGHSDIAPGRKTDPGPLFDWHKLT